MGGGAVSDAHFLVVHPWDSEAEPSDLIEVEHPPGCPTVMQYEGDDEHPGVVVENCAVGFYINEHGLSEYFGHADDPDRDDRFSFPEWVGPGRHEIEAWHEVHPGGPWGPTEYDAGIRLADQEVPT